MKKQFLLSAVLCLSLTAFGQKVHQLASPSGNIRISVELTDQIQYDVTQGNQTLMDNVSLVWKLPTTSWASILN